MAASIKDLERLPDWPALMSQQQAAAYISKSVTTFLKWVEEGVMPPPLRLPGRAPSWSRVAIDRQIEALSALRRPRAGERELIERAENGSYSLSD